jgi:Protein of unknown function (DUF2029).
MIDRRWSGPLAAGLAMFGLLVLGLAISNWIGRSPGWAYDFHAYYDAALRLIATGTPYQAETLSGPFRPGPYGLYLYSPILAALFVPLTWLGEQGAILVWLAVRLTALALTCALMPIPRRLRLATFGVAALSAPVLFDLDLGNVSLLVTFAAVLAWRWLDRPLSGVALAAALVVRPLMAVIVGWWVVRGVWRPAVATVAAFGAIVLVSLAWLRLDVWFQWLTVLRNVSDVTGVKANIDLGSAVLLLGGSAGWAQVALYAGYALAALAILFSLRRDRELSYVVTLMATLLVSPLLWDHYLTNLLVPAAFLAARGRWWGLALPLLCWAPTLLVALVPSTRPWAEALLAPIAVAAVVLPFLASNDSARAGPAFQRLGGRGSRPNPLGAAPS